jgi:hypothetical protein
MDVPHPSLEERLSGHSADDLVSTLNAAEPEKREQFGPPARDNLHLTE